MKRLTPHRSGRADAATSLPGSHGTAGTLQMKVYIKNMHAHACTHVPSRMHTRCVACTRQQEGAWAPDTEGLRFTRGSAAWSERG